MLVTRRRARSGPIAARTAIGACALALACAERERPERLADPQGDDAERAVSGSFRAPSSDAAGGAGGTPSAIDGGRGSVEPGAGRAGAADAGAALSSPLTLQQTYEGTCEGSTVQWGFLTFRAATPSDSSILFRVRTAASEAELPRAGFFDLVTASAALGTDHCGFTGPAPCPIDLYELLGGAPLAHHPFAQLEVLLSPASADGRLPAVEEWQLTYSCTFNQ